MNGGLTDHAAAASAMGYLYQCRYALLAALREIPDRPQLSVSIERFDDIAFDELGKPDELIQTKHHTASTGSLTDQSVDLWKTLRVWMDQIRDWGQLGAPMRFVLLTTATASEGAAASFLRSSETRSEEKARDLLIQAATRSKSQETQLGRSAFLGLSEDEQHSLLSAILVVDSSPDILGAYEELCKLLSYSVPRGKVGLLVQRLEGWWFSIVIEALMTGNVSVPLSQIEDKIDELREDFGREDLPIDTELLSPSSDQLSDLDRRDFVRQLQFIGVRERRISFAVRDYYRAFHQRSRWVRDELLFGPEIAAYESILEESWQPRFEEMCERLNDEADEKDKAEAGNGLFRWVEQDAQFPLRRVTSRFLCHGSYHMLADIHRVGWHPDYSDLLQSESEATNPEEDGLNAAVAAAAH